jgi:hypothetical protein
VELGRTAQGLPPALVGGDSNGQGGRIGEVVRRRAAAGGIDVPDPLHDLPLIPKATLSV